MDEIINTLLNETAGKDKTSLPVPDSSPYLKDRMAELDEEYQQMQEKLLKAVQSVTREKERELEAMIS